MFNITHRVHKCSVICQCFWTQNVKLAQRYIQLHCICFKLHRYNYVYIKYKIILPQKYYLAIHAALNWYLTSQLYCSYRSWLSYSSLLLKQGRQNLNFEDCNFWTITYNYYTCLNHLKIMFPITMASACLSYSQRHLRSWN